MLISNPKKLPFTSKQWIQCLKEWNIAKGKQNIFKLVDGLTYKPINVTKLQQKKEFIAFDTETFASNGNLICLCNSKNLDTLYGSVTEQPTIEEYFNYFNRLSEHKKNIIFGAWNLKFDALIILKCLPKTIAYDFYYGDEDGKYKYKFNSGLELSYLPKKALTLRYKGKSIILYDFLQFFGKSLESASNDFENELKEKNVFGNKNYDGKYKDKKFPDNIETHELEKIVKYCQKDCLLTANLMEIWVDAFYKNFNFIPDKYYSSGYLSKTFVQTKFENFNSFKNIPYIVNSLAYYTYFGGRFENTVKGSLTNVHHWDINSAYPYAMSLIPDFLYGSWKKVFKFNPDIKAGYYKIKINVDEKNIAPFPYRDPYGRVAFPKGEFTTFITNHELKSAIKNYNFKLIDLIGYEFTPKYIEPSPFNNLVKEMYNKRLDMAKKSKAQSTVYKVLVNSLYGKFAQAKPSPKGFFNPVVASYITGFCRSMLLDAAANHKENIIMFATDGIFADKNLKLEVTKEKILGKWDYEYHPNFSVIMPGIYSYNTKKNQELNTHSRGFSLKVYPKELDKKPITFNLNDYTLTQENGKYYYEFFNERPIAFSEAVIQKDYDIEIIGKFRKIRKEIDLNGERKRLWYGELKNINDLIHSETRDVKLL